METLGRNALNLFFTSTSTSSWQSLLIGPVESLLFKNFLNISPYLNNFVETLLMTVQTSE